jgi:ABC-type lipoprotein export system ATPase subunit
MDIQLKNIMPKPLASIQHSEQSIWGNEIDIPAGKKIMLNASSGKGKSTFTSVIFGLRSDYEGQLLFDGKDAKSFSASDWTELRKSKLSVVFQDLQLFPGLTVKENLEIKNRLTNTFSENELKHMLQQLGIADKWEQKCGILSMGQQQRVAIIRALAQPFECLILDEPFSHLDVENTRIALELIDTRCKQISAGFVLTSLGDSHDFTYDITLKL